MRRWRENSATNKRTNFVVQSDENRVGFRTFNVGMLEPLRNISLHMIKYAVFEQASNKK